MKDTGKDFSQDELIKIEARLIEQEHRPFTLIKTFFNRKKWSKEDPRRTAAKTAILWRILFSPGVITATGGLLAFLSLWVLIWQTRVLLRQNELITDQNDKINQQTYLIEAQRRSSLQFEISEILNRIDDELEDIGTNPNRSLSDQLKSRIIAATVSMKPYRSYENDSLQSPYSYEKGQFFIALVNSKINEDDLNQIFDQGNFSYMILNNVVFGSYQNSLVINKLEIKNSYFKDVEIRGIEVEELTFDNTILEKFKLFGNYQELSFTDSKILEASIAFSKDHFLGPSILFLDNSEIKNSALTGDENDFPDLDVAISGGQVSIKNSSINSLKLEVDVLNDRSKLYLENLILTDGYYSNIDLSGIENHIESFNVYVPENSSPPDKAINSKYVGTLDGEEVVEKLNDNFGFVSYFVLNGQNYKEYKIQ